MRAGAGAGSKSGRRSCPYRFGQVSNRPRQKTEGHINEALRLSPRDIYAFRWLLYVGFAKVQVNTDAEAVAWFLRSVEANRNYPIAHFALAAALALLGSLDQARAAAKAGLTLDPKFTIRRFHEVHRVIVQPSSPSASASITACAWPGCRRADVADGSN